MSGEPVCRVVILIAVKDLSDQGGSGTHTGLQIEKAPPPGNPMRRFQLPLLGSNQDSPDPESLSGSSAEFASVRFLVAQQ
jgi:hypothetical protein